MGRLVLYDGPAFAEESKQYYVEVNGRRAFVHPVRVSSKLVNQLYRGKQRDLSETEMTSMVSFDFEGTAHMRVVCEWQVFKAKVVPDSRHVKVTRAESNKGDELLFDITEPGQYVLEINGVHCPLHIFANPIEKDKPDKNDPNVCYIEAEEKTLYCGSYTGGAAVNICEVIADAVKNGKTLYFGPGIHQTDAIYLEDNSRIYIDGGAIIYGSIIGKDKKNIKIYGRGIIDGSRYSRDIPDSPLINSLYFGYCDNVEVEGIFVRDSAVYNVATACCKNVHYNNIKIISWRPNSDGADFHNTEGIHIENSFIRCFDDCICIKGQASYHGEECGHMPSENVLVEKSVIWTDWGRALEIGAETSGDYMRNVIFKNIDVVHFAFIACDVQACGDAPVSDITFDDIRVGEPLTPDVEPRLLEVFIWNMIWMKDEKLGNAKNIKFRNIRYDGLTIAPCRFIGRNEESSAEGIYIDNVILNGRQMTEPDDLISPIIINDYAKDIYLNGRLVDRSKVICHDEETVRNTYLVGNGAFMRA